jgi:hypothetical protein
MFASPYLRRRASALAVLVCLVALALLALPGSSSGAAYGGDTDSHVQAIARASHLDSALIVPGQRLVLP